MRFDFQEKTDLLSYCIKLAEKMHFFKEPGEMSHLIRQSYTALKFDPERTKELAACLTNPANTLCFLTSKSFQPSEFDKKDPWMGTDFHIEKYNDELLNLLKNPVVADNGKKLDLPPENNLLPKNFDILAEDAANSAKPTLIHQWEDTDLWFKKDDQFKKPKGIVTCKIYSSDLYFGQTPKARVFGLMW